jgi:hypothetical protein
LRKGLAPDESAYPKDPLAECDSTEKAVYGAIGKRNYFPSGTISVWLLIPKRYGDCGFLRIRKGASGLSDERPLG